METLRKLRELTGAGVLECKKALEAHQGDLEKAKEYLRKKGFEVARKKAAREVREGQIASYVHLGGKIGVLVEIHCETDFVARCDEFQKFLKDVAMQVAAKSPRFVSKGEIPSEALKEEKTRIRKELGGNSVKEEAVERALAGWVEEVCLLEQTFIRDEKRTVKDCLTEVIAKTGENIVIRRFVRFELGEGAG